MITSRVEINDHFDKITIEIERRAVAALNAAATEAAQVADARANTPTPIARFQALPAMNIGDGYASGVKAGPLTRIFDHGSLGKRDKKLKRLRTTASWQVTRGTNPYTATRSDYLDGKGIAPRGILNAARTAGRRVLISRLINK